MLVYVGVIASDAPNMNVNPILEKPKTFLLNPKVLPLMMNGDTIRKWSVSKRKNTIG